MEEEGTLLMSCQVLSSVTGKVSRSLYSCVGLFVQWFIIGVFCCG